MSERFNLASGGSIPSIGLGTWQSSPGEVGAAVRAAVGCGYRHIDCAYGYQNEREVGQALRDVIAAGDVTREDLFITSKLWNSRHRPDDVRPSLQESLDMLGLQYLDLYLIHWPQAFKNGPGMIQRDADGNVIYDDIHYLDTWKALEQCVDDGLIKAIGVSNFNKEQILTIMQKGRIKPSVLQVEVHPYFSQEKIVSFCKQHNIVVTAYSPLGSSSRPWKFDHQKEVLTDETLLNIAKKNNKSVAQICLRWNIQRGVAVIPKSVKSERLRENFQLLDFELSSEDMAKIDALNINQRTGAVYVQNKDGTLRYRDAAAPHWPWGDDVHCQT